MLKGTKIKSFVMTLILLMSATISFAQYYSWGADPVRLKWMESKGSSTSVIYPRDAEQIGLTTLYHQLLFIFILD